MPSAAPILFVTVVNLSRDARTPVRDGGPVELGNLSESDFIALLEAFIEVDALENMKADSEIRVQNRRHRFIVRTEARKLMLHDARNPNEPAYVLSAPEIVAELDGSAAAKRTAPPIPISIPQREGSSSATPFEPTARPAGPPPRPPILLLVVVLALAGYLAYSQLGGPSPEPRPELAALPPTERQTEDAALVGVYTTGPEPGQHGIIVMGDGKLKLYRVNAQAAPSVVPGTYKLGRVDGRVHLETDQPGGLIKVVNRESLQFCGELYKRVP